MDDNTMKLSIAMLKSFFDKNDLSEYNKSITSCIKSLLSDMSLFHLKSKVVISQIAQVANDIYVKKTENDISALNESNVDNKTLSEIIDATDGMVTLLSALVFDLETLTGAPRTSFNIYSKASGSEDEDRLRLDAYENPNIMTYFSAKDLLVENTKILKSFSDFKAKIETGGLSLKNSIPVHFDYVVQITSNSIKNMLEYYRSLSTINEAIKLCIKSYDFYKWGDRVDTQYFLGRPFADIRADFETVLGEV